MTGRTANSPGGMSASTATTSTVVGHASPSYAICLTDGFTGNQPIGQRGSGKAGAGYPSFLLGNLISQSALNGGESWEKAKLFQT